MKAFKSIRSFFRGSNPKKDSPKKQAEMKEKFNERFELGDVLGKGNFSVVKQATDKLSGEEVAVKCIGKRHLSKEDREAIVQEVDILKALDHPNIIKLYGMFEDSTYIYIITELVRGGELFDRIVEKEFYSENDAAKVVRTIAEALKYCNENGVVHRDLKPENVLLVDSKDDSTIKLADFGFAKEVNPDGEGELKTTCGTPGYVAPEIISGKKYGKEVDMWSLGVLLYILLCGYPPFYSENQADLFKMIKKGRYKFDPTYWADISDEAKDLVKGLLTVQRDARFDVDHVLEHPWIQNGGAEADITPALDKLRGYQARRRLKRAANAVLAVNRLKKAIGGLDKIKEDAVKETEEDDDKEEDGDEEPVEDEESN